mmetsp:Transcript_81394/g.263609  ORF Transcript_81394/g.263609 Transcript_81394/m.263609 type:complete len:149 (-) Transcript_81394:136-582(-)
MPVDPWALIMTSLFATNFEGCMCLPRACEEVKVGEEKVCGIPFQGDNDVRIGDELAMPYVGSKCEYVEGKCLSKGCEATDLYHGQGPAGQLGRLGRVGRGTYNCWRSLLQDFEYKSRLDRVTKYAEKLGIHVPELDGTDEMANVNKVK